jgi:putative ABC transport system permease protein
MTWLDAVLSALDALRLHKLRSALTMLGLVIGVAAVIAMMAVGAGAREQIIAQIRSLGSNLLVVIPGNITQAGVRLGTGASPTLSDEDAAAITTDVPAVQVTAPFISSKAQVIAGNVNWATTLHMIDPGWLEARDWALEQGRLFGSDELARGAQVALLGRTVANTLFPDNDADPVGQTIRIGKVPFQVIGTMARKGQSGFGQDQDDMLLIPLTTGQRLGGRNQVKSHSVGAVYVKVRDGENLTDAQDDVADLLRQRHRLQSSQDDDFSVRNLADLTAAKEASASTLSLLLAAVASVSLGVGGIGIMNIMLVSVTERTREIGIRLALGARGFDILRQFLLEAVTLTIIGGTVGVLGGLAAAYVISQVAGWPLLVEPSSVLMAVLVSGLIGIFFGWWPAMRAAGLDPIDALRHS